MRSGESENAAARAVIFDMDGVLVDSYRAHFESWDRLARERGLPWSERTFAETFGRTSREIVRLTWGETIPDECIAQVDRRKEELYRAIVEREFPAMDGAVELIDALWADGFRLAVGSSGPPENVELVLRRLGRRDRFKALVTGRDVTRGKPDPQVFRLAAARLGLPAPRCLVVEDAPAGIESAHRAGMKAIALVSTGRRAEDFLAAQPERTVTSLRSLTARSMAGLLGAV